MKEALSVSRREEYKKLCQVLVLWLQLCHIPLPRNALQICTEGRCAETPKVCSFLFSVSLALLHGRKQAEELGRKAFWGENKDCELAMGLILLP